MSTQQTLTDEQEKFAQNIENRVQKLLQESKLGLITEEQYKTRETELVEKFASKFPEAALTELSERITGLAEKIANNNTKSDKEPVKLSRRESLKVLCRAALESDSFKNLQKGKISSTEEFDLRTISVTSDYDGSIGKTTFIDSLEFKPSEFPLVRSILPQGDTENTTIVHPYAKDFNPNVAEYDENAEIQDGTFAFDETTSYVQRWGTAFPISRNFLKNGSLASMVNTMLMLAEKQVNFRENFLLINGTGATGKIKGLLNGSTLLTLDGITFAAGSVASISELATGKVIVNFAADHNLRTGYKITFANATHAGYNATFDVTVRSLRSIVINIAYVAEAVTAAWTATAAHPAADAFDNARYYDALKVVISAAIINEYTPTGGYIHPTMCDMMYERDTTGQLIALPGVTEDAVALTFNGVRFIKTTAVPVKTVIVGDLQSAVQVLDFEGMTMQISEDSTDKKKNQYQVIISQQTGMPILNQYVIYNANLDTIKTAIEKP